MRQIAMASIFAALTVSASAGTLTLKRTVNSTGTGTVYSGSAADGSPQWKCQAITDGEDNKSASDSISYTLAFRMVYVGSATDTPASLGNLTVSYNSRFNGSWSYELVPASPGTTPTETANTSFSCSIGVSGVTDAVPLEGKSGTVTQTMVDQTGSYSAGPVSYAKTGLQVPTTGWTQSVSGSVVTYTYDVLVFNISGTASAVQTASGKTKSACGASWTHIWGPFSYSSN